MIRYIFIASLCLCIFEAQAAKPTHNTVKIKCTDCEERCKKDPNETCILFCHTYCQK